MRRRKNPRRIWMIVLGAALTVAVAFSTRRASAAPNAASPSFKTVTFVRGRMPSTPAQRSASAIRSPASAIGSIAPSNVLRLQCFKCDDAQRTAAEHAIKIWNRYLYSPVRINVHVEMTPLGPNVLALNIPVPGFYGVAGSSYPAAVYPPALAELLEGVALNGPDSPDILVQINSSLDWYTGLDGRPGAYQMDLVTAVLHEVCHGLGVATSLNVSLKETSFAWGYVDQSDQRLASIYDIHLVYDSKLQMLQGRRITEIKEFEELIRILKYTFFGDSGMLAAILDTPATVYYDADWEAGSSLSHLSFSRLMSHDIATGQSCHEPEEELLEVLRSLGWATEPVQAPTACSFRCDDGDVAGVWKPPAAKPDGYIVLRTSDPVAMPPALCDGEIRSGQAVRSNPRGGGRVSEICGDDGASSATPTPWEVVAVTRTAAFRDNAGCKAGTRYTVLAYNAPQYDAAPSSPLAMNVKLEPGCVALVP